MCIYFIPLILESEFSLTDKITLAMKAQLIKLPKPKVMDSDNYHPRPHAMDNLHVTDI